MNSKRIYVAIPYTGHEKHSFRMANHAAYEIIKMGHIPFSPISMSHPIVEQSKHDGKFEKELLGTWEVWEKIDYAFIEWCDELWVVNLDEKAVNNSTGVQAEIEYAKKLNKPIRVVNVIYNETYRTAAEAMRAGAHPHVVDELDFKEWEYTFKFPINNKQ